MELRRLKYSKVYGHLSGEISFKSGENFLVGINGSGKTTALNLIRWMLGPSLPDLLTLDHEQITLDLRHKKYLYSIQSEMKKNQHVLRVVTKDKSRDYRAINTTLVTHPRKLRIDSNTSEVRMIYSGLSPEPHEVATWNFLLEELPVPVFVGLEREVKDKEITNIRKRRSGHGPQTQGRVARQTATELIRDAFNTSTRQLVEINEELNRQVLELSFSGVVRRSAMKQKITVGDIRKKITQLKKRFEQSSDQGAYSKALSSPGVRRAVVRYLQELESLLSDKASEDNHLWIVLNQHNFDKASSMFDLFEKHEINAQLAQSEIRTFRDAVNMFLQDSGKEISFDKNTGTPYFTSYSHDERLGLEELSSGEAQIVVLLSYFAFLAKTGVPIIIDEPELSLHVEWQRHFVEAVKVVMPPQCQTIMATHSPEICGAADVNVQAITLRKHR